MYKRQSIPILAVVLAFGGCDTPAEPDRVAEPAVLVYHGETSRVLAPDTVARGAPFAVQFVSFGAGCTRAIAETRVVTARHQIELLPYDWRRIGGICEKRLAYLTHRATVRIAEAGTYTIRVRGERRGGRPESPDGPVDITRQLVVR